MNEPRFSDDQHKEFVKKKLDSIDKNLTWIVKAIIGLVIGAGIIFLIKIGIDVSRGIFH
jgi:hypothetical protein